MLPRLGSRSFVVATPTPIPISLSSTPVIIDEMLTTQHGGTGSPPRKTMRTSSPAVSLQAFGTSGFARDGSRLLFKCDGLAPNSLEGCVGDEYASQCDPEKEHAMAMIMGL